ncbi:MAG: hypothetical protein AAGI48_16690 [Verrucomicrobiota bacterium]
MKRILLITALACLPLGAMELDTEGVGRDLNGWQAEGVAWYGTDGLSFRASKPVLRQLEGGAVEITMKVEEVKRRTSVYLANVRVVASPDGLVLAASVSGEVDGASFESGEVTRPEPATVAEPTEGEEASGEVDVTPVNAEKQMRDDLDQMLDSAIARALEAGEQPRRDLASRVFSVRAGETSSLVMGTSVAVRSLFRRVGP